MGNSKAAGLMRLILSEAKHFPDLALFYMDEVVRPAHAMLSRAVQRGIDRGEFRTMDINSVVQALIAPAHFMVIYQFCADACANPVPLASDQFIGTQIDLLIHGLETRPDTP